MQTPAPAASVTLYCIPHAGGSAAFYAPLGAQLPAGIACRPLELPGRGRRLREPLHTDMKTMARDLLSHMTPQAPYALFGHSMGAQLALLCALMAQEGGLPPQALFVSAAAAPVSGKQHPAPILSTLSPRELWDRLIRLGGLPEQVAASEDFRKYLEPIFRADLTALESWRPAPMPPLSAPISALLGERDTVTEEQASQWRQLTSGEFRLCTFPGHHFYLQDHWRNLADHISQVLAPVR